MTYEIDYENDGYIRIKDDDTISRYRALRYDAQPPRGNYFWAFDKAGLLNEVARMKRDGAISQVSDLVSGGAGLFGTREALRALDRWYLEQGAMIAEECDPHEVYLYEYNNHECFVSWDGDLEAIKTIIRYYGYEVAKTIQRRNAYDSLETIINEYFIKRN